MRTTLHELAPSIQLADTDAKRSAVGAFLKQQMPQIHDNAVPAVSMDDVYNPTVAYVDDAEGAVVAAALTNRAQVVVAARYARKAGLPMPPGGGDYATVADRHSELDLFAVAEDRRNEGLGGSLLVFIEYRLLQAGVRVWFGNVLPSVDAEHARRFYERHGFTMTQAGLELPPLLGHHWVMPMAEPPEFYFYKSLTARGEHSTSVTPRVQATGQSVKP